MPSPRATLDHIRPSSVVVLLVAVLCTGAGLAAELRIVPSPEVNVDEGGRSTRLRWTVKNDSAAPALEVALELPGLNESHSISKLLAPGETAAMELTIPFTTLGIERRGGYALAYRILYRDTNLYPFSAPYLISIALPPVPSRSLSASLDGASISLSDQVDRTVLLQNVAAVDAQVDRIETVAPLEIIVMLKGPRSSFRLTPGESREIDLSVQRSGALAGSSYVLGLLASGFVGDRHFADETLFNVKVVDPTVKTSTIMGGILAVLVLAILARGVLRSRRHARA